MMHGVALNACDAVIFFVSHGFTADHALADFSLDELHLEIWIERFRYVACKLEHHPMDADEILHDGDDLAETPSRIGHAR